MIACLHSLSFTVLFQAFVLLVAATRVSAGPLSVQRRNTLDVYNPAILQPTGQSNWTAGLQEIVLWDTSNAPKSVSNQGHVVLKTLPANPAEVSQWKHLAGPFNLNDGQVNVTVPVDVITGLCTIILFGDSGNESPAFHVNGVDGSDGYLSPDNNNDEI